MRRISRGAAELWHSERPFVIALAAGLLVRVLVQVAFPPATLLSDGPTYLRISEDLHPHPHRPVGYSAVLWAMLAIHRELDWIAVVQHLLGVLVAVAAYALLRRRGVSTGVATLGVLPLLLDGMQLSLEHSILTDVLFHALVVGAVVVLAWRPEPGTRRTAAAGLLIGAATLVRVVGAPAVVAAGAFVLLAAATWRARLAQTAVLVVAFLAPVTAYAAWFHSEHGVWSISEMGGRALYMRTTSFVDCAEVTVPDHLRVLCPAEPLGERRDPTFYGWHDERTVDALELPPGVTQEEALDEFAWAAIRQQPLDYARIVLRDLALPFTSLTRTDHYEYDTAWKWQLETRIGYEPTRSTGPAFERFGGEMPDARRPLADLLGVYGTVVHVTGPLMLALLLLSVVGFAVRRPQAPPVRPLIFLLVGLGIGLILVPALTAQFTWRYQLTLVPMIPLAAALAWTRLRSRPSGADAPLPRSSSHSAAEDRAPA